MVRIYHPYTEYVDSGKRTTKADSAYNILLGHFDRFSGKTFDQASDEIIASNWSPPSSQLFTTQEEKKKFVHDYFKAMVKEKYLRPVIDNS